ncbi:MULTISPECIES: response regulator [unclassified Clostridium]|uniref:response regulator n=1 Tax=unclassified Clostridium TaxID=2614128 RepID=UPI0002984466|nr:MULTISPECIES: response regulator [unclassified Clostridium]EKQ53623.1 MAG: response regulator (CheY-like and SARP domain containing protein) [Clostridium sp. Maddingley MBC34-26]
MIRVIIVDDELPALKMAESVLREFDDVLICGTFSDQDELLECIPMVEVDLLLLDIKMPGMHGLELAERIKEIRSDIFIVFVTAYDSYAIEAFETDALDYIMKPITEKRMKKTLERYIKRCGDQKKSEKPRRIYVNSFGRFSVESEHGEKMKFRTVKTEELLAFLIHHQGNPVSKGKIIEELWYDRDADKAQSILYTTLYQLRKDLESFGLNDVIENSRKEGGICRLLWSPDYWDCGEYMKVYKQYKDGKLSVEDVKRAIEIHQNGYLIHNGYRWAVEKQAELELNCSELLESIVDNEVQKQRFEFALIYLKKWAEIVSFNESIHAKIIAIYLLINNKGAAILHYQKIKEIFEKEAGLAIEIDINTLILNPYLAF